MQSAGYFDIKHRTQIHRKCPVALFWYITDKQNKTSVTEWPIDKYNCREASLSKKIYFFVYKFIKSKPIDEIAWNRYNTEFLLFSTFIEN